MELYAKLTDPQNGWDYDKNRAKELLKVIDSEEILRVDSIAIGRSSTDVSLTNLGNGWNSVQFTFFVEGEKGLVEYDIFEDKHNLSQIEHTYKQLF